MPEGMNGFELDQSLRKQRVDLKVVISSGYNEELAGSEVRNQAGMAYLQKPYAVEELSRTIRACLERG